MMKHKRQLEERYEEADKAKHKKPGEYFRVIELTQSNVISLIDRLPPLATKKTQEILIECSAKAITNIYAANHSYIHNEEEKQQFYKFILFSIKRYIESGVRPAIDSPADEAISVFIELNAYKNNPGANEWSCKGFLTAMMLYEEETRLKKQDGKKEKKKKR